MKDGGGFSLGDAVWDIEAALNYTAGDLSKHYEALEVDSMTLQLDLVGDEATAASVYAAYNTALAQILPLTTEEQHVVLIDVEDWQPGDQVLNLNYQIGSGYDKGAPNNSYGVNDDHWWSQLGPNCYCGTNSNTNARCAHKEIEHRINVANFHAIRDDEILVDVETWKVDRWPTNFSQKRYNYHDPAMAGPAPLGDWYRDTRTFTWRTIALQGGPCVQDNEMTYWTGNATEGTWSAVTIIWNTHCPTKLFLNSVGTAYTFTQPVDVHPAVQHMHHEWAFKFGRIVPGTGS